jgi:flagellar hook protein FlgE
MGIFDALNTSVGGLQAQSFALQNISGNIANASTVGYKGINTSFEDLIPAALAVNKQVAGGVTAHAQQTITTQGTVSNSTVATNIAINGDGFFDVQKPTGITDNVPTFNGVTNYTRAGDFQVNAQGYLVNSAGYYLMGQAVDPKTGNPLGSVPTVLQFNNNFVPAQATTAIQYAANLPTVPKTTASPNATAGSFVAQGGLNPADFSQNPEVLGTAPPAFGNSKVTGNQVIIGGNPIAGGAAPGGTALNSLPTSIDGKSITVDGAVINFKTGAANPTSTNFVASIPANPNATPPTPAVPGGPYTINVDPTASGGATIGDLLAAIDTINGNTGSGSVPSTISATPASATPGEITLNTGINNNLVITDNNSNAVFSQLGFSAEPAATRTGGGGTGTGVVVNSDLTTFDNESISGGAITVYNSAGTPVNVQLRWALTSPNTWNLFYQSNSSPALPGDTAWTNVGTNFVFNSNGNLVSPTGGGITIPNLTVNNQQVGDVRLNIASGALSQFASTTGNATVGQITQNGFAAGQLQSVAINNSGLVVGTFSNGQNIDLAQITLSHFNGTNYLQALDGQAYAATAESGPAIQGASGTIAGSSLEGSNTDIADEFTKLIVTQQAYSANTKVITTANDMVQSLLNVLR